MEYDRDHRKRVTAALPTKTCDQPWQNKEPRLDEALADPVVRIMMRADRVDPKELERNLRHMARKLSGDGARDPGRARWDASGIPWCPAGPYSISRSSRRMN